MLSLASIRSGRRNFDALTPDQKKMLAAAGGERTQLMLGKISSLYKVVPSREVQEHLFGKIAEHFRKSSDEEIKFGSEFYKLAFDVRETMALNAINQYLLNHPNQRDVLRFNTGFFAVISR